MGEGDVFDTKNMKVTDFGGQDKPQSSRRVHKPAVRNNTKPNPEIKQTIKNGT